MESKITLLAIYEFGQHVGVRGGGGAGCLGGEPRAPVRSQETGVEEDLQHNVRVLQ